MQHPDRQRSPPRSPLRPGRWPVLALGAALGTSCADGWFYRPGPRAVPATAGLDVHAEELAFAAPGGPQLHGWWLPAAAAVRGTVVYCHGNKGNVAHHLTWVQWLPAHGFNVLLFDYRGYGRSDGSPSRAGTIADAIAAIDLALQRDALRTVVFGHSLGGAIAIHAVAARPSVCGIVAESTFPSYRAAARAQVPLLGLLLQFLVSDGDDPEDVLDRLPPRPLLVVHGTEDRTVPFGLGRALFEQALPPKRFHEAIGSGHRSPLVREGAAFEQLLVEFFIAAIEGARDRRE